MKNARQFFILLLLAVLPLLGFSQSKKNKIKGEQPITAQYIVYKYENDSVLCRRTSKEELMRLRGRHSASATYADLAELDLQQVKENLDKGIITSDFQLDKIKQSIKYITDTLVNVNEYYAELNFYRETGKKIEAEKIRKRNLARAKRDSTERAQDGISQAEATSNEPKTELDKDAGLKASMKALAPHGLLTKFNGMDLNFVNWNVQDFMSKYMGMKPIGDQKVDMTKPIKTIETIYVKSISQNNKQHKMSVKYYLVPEGNKIKIKSCEISGYWDYVVMFYVKYWNTTLNFEEAKGKELVVNHLIDDRVALEVSAAKALAKIKVEKQK